MRQRRRGVEQAGVERQLVCKMRRIGAVEFEFGELRRVVKAVLARRQHVAKAAGIVGAVGLDRRLSRCGAWHRGATEHARNEGELTHPEPNPCRSHSRHPSPLLWPQRRER